MYKALSDHYRHVAVGYDKSYSFMYAPIANFIQDHVDILPDHQLLDIGGGTAEISRMIRKELNLIKPVVCVDPSQDMLDMATKKEDVIGVKATGEEFFSTQPQYPLDVVLMINCVHHFTDIKGMFSNLATFMPINGVCIITVCDARCLPYFQAAKDKYIGLEGERLEELCQTLESSGLKLKMASNTTPVQVDKEVWYNLLRNRHDSGLWRFTDDQLEKGIEELEVKYKDVDTLKFNYITEGFIISKI